MKKLVLLLGYCIVINSLGAQVQKQEYIFKTIGTLSAAALHADICITETKRKDCRLLLVGDHAALADVDILLEGDGVTITQESSASWVPWVKNKKKFTLEIELPEEQKVAYDLGLNGSSICLIEYIRNNARFAANGTSELCISEAIDTDLAVVMNGACSCEVEGGSLKTYHLVVSGSGTMKCKALVKDADVTATGSVKALFKKVTGQLTQKITGSATVTVEEKEPA